ncbi:PH and SEC7 domain-containing protein isoform X2 [Toxorhynchites rutilus septentrionalis]|uniref:PH and SEC7 domain-containing protein isoform X2 n=1 Tax=Toxorhynchites rutilus septentrionalis TaxID=329112 RepID=UPI0024791666|nr:PH and SEC7 domain-containing protein isoform X2 [Toxorhynchites rutilus septentrionalis]
MAEEELMVVLRKSEDATFGFSLLRTDGFPHVIYDIVENSPAAECGEVEAGDVIVKVNGTDVHGFTTKDVLKCLRLSTDPVTLELKRDPKIKAHVRKYLASISNQHPHSDDHHHSQNSNPSSPIHHRNTPASPLSERGPSRIQSPALTGGSLGSRYGHRFSSSDPSCRPSRIPQAVQATKNSWSAPQSPHGIKPPRTSLIPTANGTAQGHHQYSSSSPFYQQQPQQQQQQPPKKGFEAFMMTGDLILNLSRTPQSSGILPQAKKIDSLRDSPSHRASTKRKNGAIAPHAKCDSSPSPTSSSSNSYSENNDNGKTPSQQAAADRDRSLKKSRNEELQEQNDQNTGSSIESIVNSSSKKLSGAGNHNNNHNNNLYMEREHEDALSSIQNSIEAATAISDGGRIMGSSTNSGRSSMDAADEQENADEMNDQRSNRTNTSGCVSSSLLGERNSVRRDVRLVEDDSNNSGVAAVRSGDPAGTGSDSVDSSSAAATDGDLHNYHSKERSKSSSSAASSGGGTTIKSESSPEMSYSVPTSPTSLSAAPILEGYALKKKDTHLANSVPTSPESGTQEIVRRSGSGIQHHHHHHHHHHHNQYLHSSNNHSSNSGGGPVGQGSNIMTASGGSAGNAGGGGGGGGGVMRKCDAAGFRTSRSEDHLQQTQRDGGIGAVVPIDIDEDVNSSLNTLLDTRHDSEESQASDHDRIVWTYNAPISQANGGGIDGEAGNAGTGIVTSPVLHSSSMSSSPQRSASDSPASPTSVSSSVMSSSGGSKGANDHTHNGYGNSGFDGGRGGSGTQSNLQSLYCHNGGGLGGGGMDHSVSEAVSNISSPDYQDEHDLLSTRDLAAMAISDPSDSDSTILVSETTHRVHERDRDRDHKIVIQVKGVQHQQYPPSNQEPGVLRYSELKDSEDELATLAEEMPTTLFGGDGQLMPGTGGRESSPPISDDGSDVDSLHSFHYSPKAVDLPSAERLAKRLYYLEGFKKSDVSRHLSKNNDFSRAVADEYLKFFLFERLTLDEALRLFLKQFSLSGETQERERVLVHFSKRYLDCNPGSFNSQDAVHTLTCAIMLLNTDLHGPNIGRKMTCSEFIENLSELNDGENFPKDILKQLYQAIKTQPLEWALDDDSPDQLKVGSGRNDGNFGGTSGGNGGGLQGPPVGSNPFLDPPQPAAIEYKKGYVMRKCCYDTNYKKSCCAFLTAPFGKRSWKMFYCTLRDLVLYLHKDEHGFRKNQMSDNVHNAIRIHHALATKASDYTKKQHVFRLQTADQSEYLFQTSDSKELQSWIDTINFVCASFSAPPLEGGVGSQKRFQRPLLPCTHTKLLLREQITSHEEQVNKLENLLAEHKRSTIPTKGLALQNYKEKEAYLLYELKRYKTYYYLLSSRMNSDQSLDFESLLTMGDSGVLMESDEILQRNRQNAAGIVVGGFGSAGANQAIIQQQPLSQQQFQQQITGANTTTTGNSLTTGGSASNRYSYRAAIYRSEAQQDLG